MRERFGKESGGSLKFLRGIWIVAVWILAVGTGLISAKMTVSAQSHSFNGMAGQFLVDAQLLGVDRDTYHVQLTIQNQGDDWEGTVRLMPGATYNAATAYDTTISLPQASRKQFTIRMTKCNIYSPSYDGSTLMVYLLDKKGKKTANTKFERFFEDESQWMYMGILSDRYSSLTYLDMGGDELYFGGGYYPVKLRELTQDDLTDELDELDFLVIDQYYTDVLTKDEVEAISDWNFDGGMLIVGTGGYAEDTLAGLENYLGVSCRSIIYAPSVGNEDDDLQKERNAADGIKEDADEESKSSKADGDVDLDDNDNIDGDSDNSGDTDGDADGDSDSDGSVKEDKKQNIYYNADPYYSSNTYFTQLTLADLQDVQNQYYSSYYTGNLGLCGSMGDGAVMVLPYALTDLGKVDDSMFSQYGDQESYVRGVLTDVCNNASIRYSGKYDNSSDNDRYVSRMMKFWGNSNSALNFGMLKLIVILYVIFVGPVLYLILRFAKKKELYWVLVPASALLGIGLIFLAGRGFKMVDTSVYSVTLENLADRGETVSYLYCYDADHREWALKLSDRYEYAGGYSYDSYRYSDTEDEKSYFYHIKKEGEALYFGVKPDGSFEDCFFSAGYSGGYAQATGRIVCDGVLIGFTGGVYGEITNETGKDFAYFAVAADDNLYVYEGLKAGETCNLGKLTPIYDDVQSYNYVSDYIYSCLDDEDQERSVRQTGQLAALGVAISSACSNQTTDKIVVIGVTDAEEKAVDDRCREIAYKCLYTIQ